MLDFSQITIDFGSFWLGFLAGIIFWLFFKRMQPRVSAALKKIRLLFSSIQFTSTRDIEGAYRKQAFRSLQAQHLFSQYFPLENILVPPCLLAPPPPAVLGEDTAEPSLLHQTLSYTPDAVEIPSAYSYPRLTLLEILSSGQDIAVVGRPGYGKTTLLTASAIQLLKGKSRFPSLEEKIPFFLKAHHILAQFPNSNLQEVLQRALASGSSPVSQIDFSSVLFQSLQGGRCLLMIDDLGSLPRDEFDRIVNFIRALKIQYPSLQIAVSTGPDYLGGLTASAFIPAAIAGWDSDRKLAFLERWESAWKLLESTDPDFIQEGFSSERDLWKFWLAHDRTYSSPLEFVLKVYGFYTNQISGTSSLEALESYLASCTRDLPPQIINALELAALYSIDQQQSSFTRPEVLSWIKAFQQKGAFQDKNSKDSPLARAIQVGLEAQILQEIRPSVYIFRQQTIAGLLASRGYSGVDPDLAREIIPQDPWAIRTETLRFFAAHNPVKPLLPQFLSDPDPWKKNLSLAGWWLQHLPPKAAETDGLLRTLTREISRTPFFSVKLKLISRLALSRSSQITSILNHLLRSHDLNVRRAAALACGLAQDEKSVTLLTEQLADLPPSQYAACYALGKISSQKALEAVADALLHGGELLRRSAAETLSNHPSEGHAALREGSTMEDILVRYAVVHGLRNINQPWSVEILDRMRIDDDQWVVRDAAQQAFEEISAPSPYIPVQLQPSSETPWLVEFAGERDSGLPAGEDTREILLQAVREGDESTKQAALGIIRREGFTQIFPGIYQALNAKTIQTQDDAELTIWQASASGLSVPAYQPASDPADS